MLVIANTYSQCYLPNFNIQLHYHRLYTCTYTKSDRYFNSKWYFKLMSGAYCNTCNNWYTGSVHTPVQMYYNYAYYLNLNLCAYNKNVASLRITVSTQVRLHIRCFKFHDN